MPGENGKKPAGRPEELYKKGLIAIEGGQYDYAVQMFRDSLALDPNFIKAADGIKIAKTRKLQQASPLLQKIRKPLYSLQGSIYKKLKKYDKALDKYESAFSMQNPSFKLLNPLADLYYEKGMTEYAEAAYKSALQNDMNNTHCLRKLGKLYIDRGNMAEAKKIYDHLASIAAADDAVMKEVKDAYALLTIDRGRWEEETSIRSKAKKDPDAEESEARETVSPELKKKLGDKITALKRRLENEPDSLAVLKELADALKELRRFDEAVPLYQKILNREPGNMDVLRSIGNIYIKSGETDKAAKILEKLHALLPENTNILKILAEIYVKQDAWQKAIEAYIKLSEMQPGKPDIHEALGRIYEQNRYFEEAIAQYEKVIELDPSRTDLHQNIGNLYLRDAKTDKALDRLRKAASGDPENTSLKKQLADLYLKEGNFEEAAEFFKEILKLRPDDAAAKFSLEEAELAYREKQVREADSKINKLEKEASEAPGNETVKKQLEDEKILRDKLHSEILIQTLRKHPENAEARFELGAAFRRLGDTDAAIKEFQQSAQSEEKAVESLHMLGLCFDDKNILDIASRQLEKAESKISETNELKKSILYDLGRVYEKMGEKDKALDKYKEIYEVDISYRDVGSKIEESYS